MERMATPANLKLNGLLQMANWIILKIPTAAAGAFAYQRRNVSRKLLHGKAVRNAGVKAGGKNGKSGQTY
jgi:hypothetical protein